MERSYTFFDKLCLQFDQALRTLSGVVETTDRKNPATSIEQNELTETEQRHAAGLMRVNHVGEICAQALYQGQALTAQSEDVKQSMQLAAQEENDHLAWCAERLDELNSRPSYLNPLWYAGSFTMGAIAGIVGDQWSLGFVVETERQVEAHLQSHLNRLPENDHKSRAIVTQMKIDEARHGDMAQASGAVDLPQWIKTWMCYKAKIMTSLAYYF